MEGDGGTCALSLGGKQHPKLEVPEKAADELYWWDPGMR
jgi:hypothetical protein